MDLDQLPDHIVYSKNVIEFVTVAAETCLFLEHAAEFPRTDFIQKSIKILPLVEANKVVSILIVVDFPAPFGPKKANISPFLTLNETSFTAVKSPNFLVKFST